MKSRKEQKTPKRGEEKTTKRLQVIVKPLGDVLTLVGTVEDSKKKRVGA